MMNRCLYCYKPLPENALEKNEEIDYHPRCSRAFFGQTPPPVLPYTADAIKDLASQIVRQPLVVTGVQPKISLDLEHIGSYSRLTLVGLWGEFILKPPHAPYPSMPEIESLTMRMATEFGIQTVPHSLIRLQTGELAYITRRIDRPTKTTKRAMEDFCQLAGKQTGDKYSGSMELVARIIRQHSSQAPLDLITLYELTLFCYLTGNADMHLKNFSLWRHNGLITLTPAYDLLATKLLMPSDNEELALTMGARKTRLRPTDWDAFAQYIGLAFRQQANIHARFQKRLPKALDWIRNSFLSQTLQDEYQALIRKRAQRLGWETQSWA